MPKTHLILPLQDNVVYRRRDGLEVTVGGTTKHYPDYVWTFSGDWYDRATGRFVHYTGESFPDREPGYRLVSEHSYRNIIENA